MRRILGTALAAAILAGGAPAALAQANDAQLTKVLAQLDAASTKFRSASANFTWDQFTSVVQEHDLQKGTIAFSRNGKNVLMVAHVKTENDQPSPKDVLYKDGSLDLYQAQIKQETILAAGANRSQAESYATLGFGSSGKDLQANWKIAFGGMDTLNGTSVAKLSLTSKAPSPNDMFTKIDIWIDPSNATSLKQVFYQPGGDTRTITNTDIKLNSVPSNAFTISVPKGTQVIRK